MERFLCKDGARKSIFHDSEDETRSFPRHHLQQHSLCHRMSLWVGISAQSAGDPAVRTSFLQVLLIPKNPRGPWIQEVRSGFRSCLIPGGYVKAGATYMGRNSPCSCPRHPLILWSMKKRCHSDILNQHQMLLSKRKKTRKIKKKKKGLLLKICLLHWWRNAAPKVQYVYFYPHWRKKQSHNFPCSVSDQHKHTRAQVHFYPLEKFSLIRTDKVLSQSNINVQAPQFD